MWGRGVLVECARLAHRSVSIGKRPACSARKRSSRVHHLCLPCYRPLRRARQNPVAAWNSRDRKTEAPLPGLAMCSRSSRGARRRSASLPRTPTWRRYQRQGPRPYLASQRALPPVVCLSYVDFVTDTRRSIVVQDDGAACAPDSRAARSKDCFRADERMSPSGRSATATSQADPKQSFRLPFRLGAGSHAERP